MPPLKLFEELGSVSGNWPTSVSGCPTLPVPAIVSVSVTVLEPGGSVCGLTDSDAVTGDPTSSVAWPVAPWMGLPPLSVTVTRIVYCPSA